MAAKFKPCSVEGCKGNAHYSAEGKRGWCGAHYRRWRKHGDPLRGGAVVPKSKAAIGDPQRFLEEAVRHIGSDCLIWPFTRTKSGYGQIRYDGRVQVVSRLVCEMIHGSPPTHGHYAAHSCGKGHEGCVNPIHVRWATPKENSADTLIHGTRNRGTRQGGVKLTEDQARYAFKMKGIIAQSKLADMLGVAPSTIQSVHDRRTWAWLNEL